ncbi:MAG TPA: hypothetical protein VGO34_15185 [Alphaproteobacteria bacterium]
MQRFILALAACVGLLAHVSSPVLAQGAPDGDKPGMVTMNATVISATVENVDKAQRIVTLRRPDGSTVDFVADERVRNFDQIAKGDKVRAEVYEETAIFVRPATEKPTGRQEGKVQVAPKGDKPGMVGIDTSEMTARVDVIDYQNRLVTLTGPQGNQRTIKVSDDVKRFDNVKLGDEVVVRHTKALAVGIVKE